MASSESISLTMVTMTLKDPDKQQSYTLHVPVNVRERCTADTSGLLGSQIFDKIVQMFTTNGLPKEKTLDYAQSLKVLADLKLLHRVMRGGEQAQSVEVSTPQSAVPTRQAVDAATLEPEMDESGNVSPLSQTDSLEPSLDRELSFSEDQGRVIWTHEAVLLLIDRRRELGHLFESSAVTQRQAWRKVAEELQEKGYKYSADDCSKKFRSLRGRHKTIKEKHRQTGSGRQSWRYFELLEEMYSGDPAVMPVTVVSSMPGQPPAPSPSTATDQEDREEPFTSTPRVPRKRRSRMCLEEPEWLKQYQANQRQMHEEKMQLEERRVKALEALVEYLKKD